MKPVQQGAPQCTPGCCAADVAVGFLCSHASLRVASLTAPGRPFASAWRHLLAGPSALRALGYRIVHSVQRDGAEVEAQLREALRGSNAETDSGQRSTIETRRGSHMVVALHCHR